MKLHRLLTAVACSLLVLLAACESSLQQSAAPANGAAGEAGGNDSGFASGDLPGLGGGGVDGNGGDVRSPRADSAWFLNLPEHKIVYCMRTAAEFGVSPQVLQTAISHSFSTWFTYIRNKQINRGLTAHGLYFPRTAVRGSHRPLPASPQAYSDCGGGEHIRFEFGTSSDLVKQEQQKYALPAAFGVRVRQRADNPAMVADTGMIWLAPPRDYRIEDGRVAHLDWQDPLDLPAVLNHEIGQIFGIGYVPGTIMDQDAVRHYLSEKVEASLPGSLPLQREKWLSLDQEQEIYVCPDCTDTHVRYRGAADLSAAGFAELCRTEDTRSGAGRAGAKTTDANSDCEGEPLLELILADSGLAAAAIDSVQLYPRWHGPVEPYVAAMDIVFADGAERVTLTLHLGVPSDSSAAMAGLRSRPLVPVFKRHARVLAKPVSLSSAWHQLRGELLIGPDLAARLNLAITEDLEAKLQLRENRLPVVLEFNADGAPLVIAAELPASVSDGRGRVELFRAGTALNPPPSD